MAADAVQTAVALVIVGAHAASLEFPEMIVAAFGKETLDNLRNSIFIFTGLP